MSAHKRHQQKRHGKHQKHTRHFLKVYSPYIPLLTIVVVGIVLSILSPPRLSNKNVLAYATSMSVNQLLSATNQDRANNGLPALKLNSKLDSAAQSKANDMVARDYWSHQTPDGQQPWVFITNAGYSYKAAGENLAYGFTDGSATVQGWMNSPEHKANMLNSTYVDVGFGFKNSSNFVGSGEETVVVAEYAAPASSTKAAATTTHTTTTASSNQTASKSASASPAKTTAKTPAAVAKTDSTTKPIVKTAAAPIEPNGLAVTRASKVTGLSITWLATAATVITALGLSALAVRHTYALHKWLRRGERYMIKHMALDLTVVSLIGLLYIASQSVGFIR
ncbi:MAG: CAP domain-containing protein [Candidatus Saccharimonadales bacterium]